MKENLKNNLKMLITFIIIAICFVLIIGNMQYKNINIKNISLFVIIIASIYFGINYGKKKKDNKKEEKKDQIIKSSPLNIPKEFSDEEDRFKKLNNQGRVR
jgi:glucan phosphoethanolaminetransferase (alkaline phosphatase superfamily)